MKKDNFKTDVIFRKEKDGDICAFFPYDISDSKGNITHYAHIGQHSQAAWEYYLKDTKPCKSPNEYNDLFQELESLGYNLNIIQRRNYKKYLNAYYAVNN
jgi:hypothetical protein